jgi:hypothetical protein
LLVLSIMGSAISGSAMAAETSYRDILGNWCGTISNYSITRQTLVVTILRDNSVRRYKIDSFEFEDSIVTVNWRNSDDKEVWTKFSEFSADGLNMVQLLNDAGPRREFRRC